MTRPPNNPLLIGFNADRRAIFNTVWRTESPSHLLVFNWNSDLRRLHFLPSCHPKAQYVYSSQSQAEHGDNDEVIRSEQEFRTRLPFADFAAVSKSEGELHVKMDIMGTYRVTNDVRRDMLEDNPECQVATHIATLVTVGAFSVFKKSRGQVGVTGGLAAGPGGSFIDGSGVQVFDSGGDFAKCIITNGDDKSRPPIGCDNVVSLLLAPLDAADALAMEPKLLSKAAPIIAWVGVASLVASGVSGGIAYAKKRDFDQSGSCPDNHCATNLKNDVDMYNSLRLVSAVTGVAGLGLMSAGIIISATSNRPEAPTQYNFGTNSNGLTLQGSF